MSVQSPPITPIFERELFIDNEWRPGSTGETLELVDPATERPFGRVSLAGEADIDAAVSAARAAFDDGPWPAMTVKERAAALVRLADELEKDIEPLTEVLIKETGQVVGASQGNVGAMAGMLRYNAGLADSFVAVEMRKGVTGPTAQIEKRPLGVVAAIIPFNAPLGLAAFKLPPALLMGCTVVMKPSDYTPVSAGYLADAALRAGLPAGVLNIVPAGPEQSSRLVGHPGVDAVTFTGSTVVGRAIAEAAAPTLKRVTLELGGKSPALVLDDAPLERIVETLVPAITNNNGEVCTVPSRLIVPRSRKDEIVSALAAAFARVKVGPPSDPGSTVGPMVNKRHYDRVLRLLATVEPEGGQFAFGGGPVAGLDTGYYLEPTIITDVSSGATVAQEEIFGPVVVVLTYEDEAEGIELANDTEFGLSGAVFSADEDRALRVAREIRSGTVNINNGITIDISVPFGGVKQSGYGRELGPEGLEPFYETRVVFIDGEPLITL
ncbi:MAG TPA: aldehyde dehydrogenase family protein [Solirubrobacterales bacterium]